MPYGTTAVSLFAAWSNGAMQMGSVQPALSVCQPDVSVPHRPERRTFTRTPVRNKKTLFARIVVDGQSWNCYLSILDLSEGGMRISTLFSFPTNRPVEIRILPDEAIGMTVRVAWPISRARTNQLGLQFLEIRDEARAGLRRLLMEDPARPHLQATVEPGA